jgi:hypothetical protein
MTSDGKMTTEELTDALSDVEDAWMSVSTGGCQRLADKLRAHIATLQREADEMREALVTIEDGPGMAAIGWAEAMNAARVALSQAQPQEQAKPHTFHPDYQAGGDCVHCGNIREDCERNQALPPQTEEDNEDEVRCVNAHDRCYGGAGGPCPYCEPRQALPPQQRED